MPQSIEHYVIWVDFRAVIGTIMCSQTELRTNSSAKTICSPLWCGDSGRSHAVYDYVLDNVLSWVWLLLERNLNTVCKEVIIRTK